MFYEKLSLSWRVNTIEAFNLWDAFELIQIPVFFMFTFHYWHSRMIDLLGWPSIKALLNLILFYVLFLSPREFIWPPLTFFGSQIQPHCFFLRGHTHRAPWTLKIFSGRHVNEQSLSPAFLCSFDLEKRGLLCHRCSFEILGGSCSNPPDCPL